MTKKEQKSETQDTFQVITYICSETECLFWPKWPNMFNIHQISVHCTYVIGRSISDKLSLISYSPFYRMVEVQLPWKYPLTNQVFLIIIRGDTIGVTCSMWYYKLLHYKLGFCFESTTGNINLCSSLPLSFNSTTFLLYLWYILTHITCLVSALNCE